VNENVASSGHFRQARGQWWRNDFVPGEETKNILIFSCGTEVTVCQYMVADIDNRLNGDLKLPFRIAGHFGIRQKGCLIEQGVAAQHHEAVPDFRDSRKNHIGVNHANGSADIAA
jgi:hypothetical protein